VVIASSLIRFEKIIHHANMLSGNRTHHGSSERSSSLRGAVYFAAFRDSRIAHRRRAPDDRGMGDDALPFSPWTTRRRSGCA
jgi:hypothetical protein